MLYIDTTKALADFCKRAAKHPFVTLDTEFLRERTYYSKLCLIQMAIPEEGDDSAALIDTLARGLSLEPLFDLFRNTDVVKVLHAARQDLEIFFHKAGVFPEPFFDTQIAAMVCGFGEQVAYDTLVRKIAKGSVDKSSRFTDWSRRPLTEDQQNYALADVTHLRDIYLHLEKRIRKARRESWVAEEEQILLDPATYTNDPATAWERIKTRTHSPRFLAIVRELARFREEYAQSNDVPRNRVFKDDALLELASMKPRKRTDLSKARLLLREGRKDAVADGIIAAVEAGLACPDADCPRMEKQVHADRTNQGLADLLRVLLKAKAEKTDVAQKLIATAAELDRLAAGETDLPSLRGWRRDVFGADAERLCKGQIALSANGRSVKIVEV